MPRTTAAHPPQPARLSLLLLHQFSKADGWNLLQDRVIGGVVDGGGDVEDALESAGGAADLYGGEGWGPVRRGFGEARGGAEEETHGADEEILDVADGEDLDGDGGGVARDEFVGDAEEELVVPVRVVAAE